VKDARSSRLHVGGRLPDPERLMRAGHSKKVMRPLEREEKKEYDEVAGLEEERREGAKGYS